MKFIKFYKIGPFYLCIQEFFSESKFWRACFFCKGTGFVKKIP